MMFHDMQIFSGLVVWNPLHWWWIPFLALALDLVFADCRRLPHPVEGIGWLLMKLEPLARKHSQGFLLGFSHGRLAGLAVMIGISLLVACIVILLLSLPGYAGMLAALYLSWSGLALGGLVREGCKAEKAIFRSVAGGRSAVAILVSRDVNFLDKNGLRRTLAESMSENLNDAFIAPFFWLVISGPIGLWVYKTISTMDSCWGYKNEAWRDLGWACARLDDLVAYVPARLSMFFLYSTAPFFSLAHNWPGVRVVVCQARSMESPNAGWPMAAAAWLHNASMGGRAVYHGCVVEKPYLGPPEKEGDAKYFVQKEGNTPFVWTAAKIQALLRHIRVAGVCGAIVLLAFACLLYAVIAHGTLLWQ